MPVGKPDYHCARCRVPLKAERWHHTTQPREPGWLAKQHYMHLGRETTRVDLCASCQVGYERFIAGGDVSQP